MFEVFDWNKEFAQSYHQIKEINSSFQIISKAQQQESDKLTKLEHDIKELTEKIGVPLTSIEEILGQHSQASVQSRKLKWDDEFFLNNNLAIVEARVKEEVLKNPELLPSLSNLDYTIVGISGLIAAILDLLIVKIPKNVNYLGKYQQEGSNFTQWLKTLGVDTEGKLNNFFKWCEDTCKVPYDQSINPNIKGFSPKTHRLFSLGHDPLFGLIFGTLDILNGTMTAFDANGKLHILKTFDMSLTGKAFAPLIWLGHIVSDMCTKMGVPIPGWAFTQLLQIGSFGSDKRTIAEISRWMYLNGYDLRHFVTMSVPVTVIEMIVRSYHYLSSLESPEQLHNSIHQSVATKELAQIQSQLKLHKMLFMAHAIAVSGNALKVFTYSANPLAINFPQWLAFIKESLNILRATTRDKTPETIVRNRTKINDVWEEIEDISI
jgi:hypothetical protein